MPKQQPKAEEEQLAGTSNEITNTTVVNKLIQPKIPPFWNEQPAAWFVLVENQFSINRIVDDNEQFAHALGALPQSIVPLISNVLTNPQPGNKYNRLKTTLLNHYAISEEQRLDELISGLQQMGDLKPSHFYRLLEQKAGDSKLITPALLKNRWLKRLPDELRAILARDLNKDIEEILPVADQIWIYAQSKTTSTIAAFKEQQPIHGKTTVDDESILVSMQRQLDRTQQQLADLQRTLSNKNTGFRGRSPLNRFDYRRRSQSRSPSRSRFCYFHRRFGSRARNCSKPCSFRPTASHGAASTNFPKFSGNE